MDGRINNGGHSTKGYAGRKPKEDENRIRTLSINALESIYGSEEKAFEHIAELSKESYAHLKLLLEYAYGKPRITQEIIEKKEQHTKAMRTEEISLLCKVKRGAPSGG